MHNPDTASQSRHPPAREPLAARLQTPSSAEPAVVEQIVREVISTMQGDISAKETALLAEVEELGRTIAAAKAEIAALQVDDITDSHIPSATDELSAIVDHTAAATNAILEVCETLDEVASGLTGKARAQLGDATTRIYEACSFQDITGQRISKVVLTLQTIDAKVAHIIATFSVPGMASTATVVHASNDPKGLLNGPQLPMAAMDQSEIDRLMADFG